MTRTKEKVEEKKVELLNLTMENNKRIDRT